MADLAVAYPGLSSTRTNASRAALEHLHAACEPSKIERYLNNERIRMAIRQNLVDQMAIGATGTDAMYGEAKRWFSGVVRMRASVLRLRLRVFHLCNMVAF